MFVLPVRPVLLGLVLGTLAVFAVADPPNASVRLLELDASGDVIREIRGPMVSSGYNGGTRTLTVEYVSDTLLCSGFGQ